MIFCLISRGNYPLKSGEWSFRPANSPKDDALQYYNLRATLTCGYLL